MFTQNPIKSRVMKAINTHINNAEKQYKEECLEIERQAEEKKTQLADTMVDTILKKII